MGKELVGLLKNADKINGVKRAIFIASTFSDPSGRDLAILEQLNVTCFKGDLTDKKFLISLPDAPNVIYMMGFKFGSSKDWERSFHLNSIVPFLVGSKYHKSKIVVFSSGNPYPHTPRSGRGCSEDAQLDPIGIYGWSIVARESSFSLTAKTNPEQKIAYYRLMYAQHLQYGVLVDLAKMIKNGEPISLAMPAVNLVSQRDANEVAIRCFESCDNDPWTLNVAGPVWQVKEIVTRMEHYLGRKAVLLEDEEELALLADDEKCLNAFGSYKDNCEDMIQGASIWVKNNGSDWGKPTHFGRAKHDY